MAKTNYFTFDYGKSSLAKNMPALGSKIEAAVLMYATTKAAEYEAYMKLERPWTDRTNQAKATLNAKVSKPNKNTVRITLAHGVEYGIWLELAHEKQYAIVAPTINIKGPEYISNMKNLMAKIGNKIQSL